MYERMVCEELSRVVIGVTTATETTFCLNNGSSLKKPEAVDGATEQIQLGVVL